VRLFLFRELDQKPTQPSTVIEIVDARSRVELLLHILGKVLLHRQEPGVLVDLEPALFSQELSDSFSQACFCLGNNSPTVP
jgi:hypothetical protein